MYIQLSLSHFSNLYSLQTYFVVEKLRTELIPLHVKLTNTKKETNEHNLFTIILLQHNQFSHCIYLVVDKEKEKQVGK